MTLLTGFTRPIDAIVQSALEAKILADTGFVVSALINPTSIDVTGSSITSSNMAAIQTSINTYVYSNPNGDPTKLDVTSISNSVPMVDDPNKIITTHSAYMGDAAILAARTANRTYINGIAQNGTALTGDIIEWIETQNTVSGGVTLYVTTQGATRTSSGTALCSTIFPDSVQTNFIDSTGVYAQGTPTVTSNKTVSIPFTKQAFSGVTVVGINVVGSASMAAIPNAVVVKTRLVGIAA